MSEDIKVTNPVEIQDNSSERVAYDLMKLIAHNEEIDYTRENLIPLYAECRKVVKNGTHKY